MHQSHHKEVRGVWSVPEHERFIEAMALYPCGPWKLITDHVGTRSIKQVQTHAQKYQQKLMRHQRGLRKCKTKLKRPEHRVDETTLDQFTHKCIVRYAQRITPSVQTKKVDTATSSSSPQSPSSGSESDSTTDEMSLAELSVEEWAEMTEDITNDAAFMHLMVDAEPIEPKYGQHAAHDWTELQFEDLLRPFQVR